MIKALRKERNLSQLKVAAILDISRSHYEKIENGRRCPSLELAEKMSEFFGKSINRLFLRH